MKILKKNFSLEKYGLKARLVNIDDAEFIVNLRSDPDRTKYMITLDADIEKQKKWIREYKKRERDGVDYYLIYFDSNDTPVGVNRISNINFEESSCKASGWIKKKGGESDAAAMFLIHKEIIFYTLGLQYFVSDINKKNIRVHKYYEFFKYEILKVENDFCFYKISKSAFEAGIYQLQKKMLMPDK